MCIKKSNDQKILNQGDGGDGDCVIKLNILIFKLIFLI